MAVEPTHAELAAKIGAVEERTLANAEAIRRTEMALANLHDDVRGLLLSEAEQRGALRAGWAGFKLGSRLTLLALAAAAGAGAVKAVERLGDLFR